jgi:hypothetical protein
VELAFELVVTAKRVPSLLWPAENMTRLSGQRSRGHAGRNVPAMRCLASDRAHGSSRNRRHGLQQMPGLRIPVERLGHLPDTPR